MDLLLHATKFAHDKHFDVRQKRKGLPVPYVWHPIQVCQKLISWGIKDEYILCSAVLHDVLEDTHTESEEIAEKFGARVLEPVLFLTKPEEMNKSEYLERFTAPFSDSEPIKQLQLVGILIKCADRCVNVEDFFESKPDYAEKYLKKAAAIFEQFYLGEFDLRPYYTSEELKAERRPRREALDKYFPDVWNPLMQNYRLLCHNAAITSHKAIKNAQETS